MERVEFRNKWLVGSEHGLVGRRCALPPALRPQRTPPSHRDAFPDACLPTDAGQVHNGLDRHATLDVVIDWTVKRDDGAAHGPSAGRATQSVVLRIRPWLSYACAPGSRLKIASPGHEHNGVCVTVQRILEDDRCVCATDSTRSSHSYSSMCHRVSMRTIGRNAPLHHPLHS